MRRKKLFWRRILVGVSALAILVTTIFSSSLASASYVSDHGDDPQRLEKIRLLYEAASRCMGSSQRKSYSLNLTIRDSDKDVAVRNAYNLNDGMFNSVSGDGSNLVYSATLEALSGGYDDGKIWCSEYNLLPILLDELGQYNVDTRNKLVCNNSEPGIFQIQSGYFAPSGFLSVRPDGVPAEDDCSGNLELLINYIENHPSETIEAYSNGTANYPFFIKMTPSPNAASRFQNVVGPLVGRLDETSSETRKSMNYWRYYQAFESGCARIRDDSKKTPPLATSTNMNALYDAVTGQIYYHSDTDIHADRDIYYDVDSTEQLTCKDLAKKLGTNIKDTVLALRQNDVKNCIDQYKQNLDNIEDRIKDYRRQQIAANGLKDALKSYVNAIQSGNLGRITIDEDDDDDEADTSGYYDLDNFVSGALKTYSNNLSNGIDNKPIYDSNLLATLVTAFEDIVNNTVVNEDHVTVEAKPEEVTFSEFNSLLDKWQDGITYVSDEIKQAEELLAEKRELANKGTSGTRDKIWKFDEDTFTLTCVGLEEANTEFANILKEAPADLDTSWSGAVVVNPDDIYENNGTSGVAATCFNSTSLGWILCSGIELVGGVTKFAYDYIVENFLTVDARYIDNPNTVEAWGVFQGFANIIFVILFIIVIFSQITGIGLTNYGIKKALPKLIVVAVLVNISYILGALAIDLSNILGDSLKTLFEGLAAGFGVDKVFSFSNVVGDVLSFILTGVGSGLVVFGAFNWDLWLPMFLLVLLGMVFSIVFFFIILAVRQAGVIILLVIAPVAIVCYALPNTKSFFERWRKMFASLLVVYPVCGALMGGGTFASTLLLAASGDSSGFFFNLVAMLIKIIPFFFIPTLVRSSMTAIGGIGNRISNLGRGLSKGTTGALRRSDGFRRFQAGTQDSAMKLNEWRARKREELRSKGRLGKIASYLPGMGGIGAAYRESNLPGAEARQKAYDRKTARRTRAVSARMDADLRDALTAKRGTEVAKATANQALREDHSKAYQRNIDFMNDVREQNKELIKALDAVEDNVDDPNNIARLRAVQDIMSRSDEGQTAMQRVYNRRLWVEQEAAKRAGRDAKVSEGMRTAAANLMNDHPELKGMNRGFFSMLTKMKSKDNLGEVFEDGNFEAKVYNGPDGKQVFDLDADGNQIDIIGNDYFDAKGGFKYDPQSIANAGESALQRLASGIGKTLPNGKMSMLPEETEAIYRSATEAITSKSIQVKPENEKYLNDIRKAAYGAMQTDFIAKNAKNFYDRQGREYIYDAAANDYVRKDSGGVKRFKLDTAGNLVSGTGSAMEQINKGKLMSASDKFERDFGRYQDLHAPLHVRH